MYEHLTIFTDIKELVQARPNAAHAPLRGTELAHLPIIRGAYLAISGGYIHSFGEMEDCPQKEGAQYISLADRYVMPTWVDSHTHLIYAASREEEFVQRIQGMSYQEIAERGGGILNSARKLREMPEDELYERAILRLQHLIRQGTGAIEIKSGYGLSAESELKMLRVAKRLKQSAAIPVRTTFLGAHALPAEYAHNRKAYLDMLMNGLLPTIAVEELADYVDIFCEKNYFSAQEAYDMMVAGEAFGMRSKIHTNQFHSIGGIQAAVELGARSVDHLEVMTNEEIQLLANSEVIGCLLPSAPFFLKDPYPPARALIDAGAAIALATDLNPGSSPSGNMNFVVSLACIQMGMTPFEAINAATINGAFALDLEKEVGSFQDGKRANFIVTRPMPSLSYFPYAFGDSHIESVWIHGEKVT